MLARTLGVPPFDLCNPERGGIKKCVAVACADGLLKLLDGTANRQNFDVEPWTFEPLGYLDPRVVPLRTGRNTLKEVGLKEDDLLHVPWKKR